MTYKEAVVISAYTGFLMCDFNDMHKYIEEKLGRPIWTHELALDEINEEIRLKCKSDFIDICKEANANKVKAGIDASFSKTLRELRRAKELTQEEMASKLGITRRAYISYEKGESKPRDESRYQQLADILGCDVDELKGGNGK